MPRCVAWELIVVADDWMSTRPMHGVAMPFEFICVGLYESSLFRTVLQATSAGDTGNLRRLLQGLTDDLPLHPLLFRGWHAPSTAVHAPTSPSRNTASGGMVAIGTRTRSATASAVSYPAAAGGMTLVGAVDAPAMHHAMVPAVVEDGAGHEYVPVRGPDDAAAARRTRSAGADVHPGAVSGTWQSICGIVRAQI